VKYRAETITNWHTGRHGGSTVLDRVVVQESIDVENNEEEETQYRELLLIDNTYTVRIWKKAKAQKEALWYSASTILPLQHGKPMHEIPFIFIDPVCGGHACKKPPLL
jgi:hypothetical protein